MRIRSALGALFLTLPLSVVAGVNIGDTIPATLSLDEGLQGKILLIDFWASWCDPCKASFPWLDSLHHFTDADRFSVLAVNEDRKPKKAERFLERQGSSFPVLFDSSGKLAATFELEKMPTSFLVDANGIIRYVHAGFGEGASMQLEKELDLLLKAGEKGE